MIKDCWQAITHLGAESALSSETPTKKKGSAHETEKIVR